MTKRIVLCADDYGQAPGISKGILELIAKKRLSAASCMVNQENWPESAQLLQPYLDQAMWGLHFNLTEGAPLSSEASRVYGEAFPGLSQLLCQSLLRKLDLKAIRQELHAQLDAFEGAIGRLPDFIDGHQHVHQFPIVQQAFLQVCSERLPRSTMVRLVVPKLQLFNSKAVLKKLVIYMMGAKAFARALGEAGIKHNVSFSGIYDFEVGYFRVHFRKFLHEITDGGLIMVHPGVAPKEQNDAIASARLQEFDYLASDLFLQDCREFGVEIEHAKKR